MNFSSVVRKNSNVPFFKISLTGLSTLGFLCSAAPNKSVRTLRVLKPYALLFSSSSDGHKKYLKMKSIYAPFFAHLVKINASGTSSTIFESPRI